MILTMGVNRISTDGTSMSATVPTMATEAAGVSSAPCAGSTPRGLLEDRDQFEARLCAHLDEHFAKFAKVLAVINDGLAADRACREGHLYETDRARCVRCTALARWITQGAS